ncbi:Helix-turn-helix domain-containing protein, partial [Actinopolyspora alba]
MASPTIRLRRLGSELQRLRKDAEYSGAQLAKAIGTSQTKLSSVEGARRKLSSGELEKAIRALRVPDTKARELRLLLEESNQLGWWEEYSDVLPDTIEMLAGLEDAASWVRRYDEAFIPALLQTPEYARAVVHAAAPYQRSGDMPRLVEFRMERQRRLRDSTFRFTSLINEGALRRQVGGREVMAAQLDQLLRLDHS